MKYLIFGQRSVMAEFNQEQVEIFHHLAQSIKPSPRFMEAVKMFKAGFTRSAYLSYKLDEREIAFLKKVTDCWEVTKKILGEKSIENNFDSPTYKEFFDKSQNDLYELVLGNP